MQLPTFTQKLYKIQYGTRININTHYLSNVEVRDVFDEFNIIYVYSSSQ